MTTRRLLSWCVAGAVLLSCCTPALALTDEEIFRDFRFNFLNPGARALGMGGAFVALADDVTASAANPAGLYSLAEPQVFVEFRFVDEDTRRFSGESGSLEVDPATGARDLPFFGVTSVSEPDTVSEPSFASLAWPLRFGSGGPRLTLFGSRQVLLSQDRNLGSGTDATEGRFSFDTFPNTVNGNVVEAYSVQTPVSGDSSMEIVYWTVGASLDVHSDFSFGYTLSFATLDLQSDTTTTVVDPLELFLDPSHPRLPAQPGSDLFRTTIDDTDSGFAYSFGIHWHPDSVFAGGTSRWRFGAVFRKGAEFEVVEATTLNDIPDTTFTNRVAVPDRYSVGLTYTSDSNWTIIAEFERIEYSDLLKDFRAGVNFLTSERLADGVYGIDPDGTVRFKADDGSLPRLGVEYALGARSGDPGRAVVRAGYYRLPDSRIRMVSFNSDDPDINDAYLAAFRGGDDENHFTVGFGYTFGRSVVEVAGDFADEITQVVGSYRFTLGGGKGGRP